MKAVGVNFGSSREKKVFIDTRTSSNVELHPFCARTHTHTHRDGKEKGGKEEREKANGGGREGESERESHSREETGRNQYRQQREEDILMSWTKD
jgi:hypothetical protein